MIVFSFIKLNDYDYFEIEFFTNKCRLNFLKIAPHIKEFQILLAQHVVQRNAGNVVDQDVTKDLVAKIIVVMVT